MSTIRKNMHWRIIYTDFYRPCPGIHGILDRTVDSYSWFHVLNTNFQYGLLSLLKAFIDIISFIQDESSFIWPIYLTYIFDRICGIPSNILQNHIFHQGHFFFLSEPGKLRKYEKSSNLFKHEQLECAVKYPNTI